MAIGRRDAGRQRELLMAADRLRALGNPFCRALDRLLEENDFDDLAEAAYGEFDAANGVGLRAKEEIRKRILIRAAAFMLGLLLMRSRFGFGTPRSLQSLAATQTAVAGHLYSAVLSVIRSSVTKSAAGTRLSAC